MKTLTRIKLAVLGWRLCLGGIVFLGMAIPLSTWLVPPEAETEVLKIFIASIVCFGVGFIANVQMVRNYLAAQAKLEAAAAVRALRP
jgi:hypothetical protein